MKRFIEAASQGLLDVFTVGTPWILMTLFGVWLISLAVKAW